MNEVTTIETDVAFVRTLPLVVVPKSQALLTRIADDLAEARDIDVCSAGMAVIAQELAGRIATVMDAMDAERLGITKPLREAAAWVNDGFTPTIDMLKKTKTALSEKLLDWNRKVAALKREQEARDAAARAAELKAAADAAAVAQKAAAELAAQSQAAALAGDTKSADLFATQAQVAADTARQVESAAIASAHVPVMRGTVNAGVKGASTKWKARITDKAKFLLRVANDPRLLDLVDINEGKLNALANLEKEHFSYPGAEPYAEEQLRTRKQAV